jgi:hypothetical protein
VRLRARVRQRVKVRAKPPCCFCSLGQNSEDEEL